MKAKVVCCAVLTALVVTSAFSVVIVKHVNRSLFIELQGLLQERDELRVEWARLQLGQGSFGAQGRIERFAKEQLQMKMVDFEQVRLMIYE